MFKKTKVLIIEDDMTMGGLLHDILRDEGCDAIFEPDEEKCLGKIEEMRPDVIITNGRNRLQFLRNARRQANDAKIIVITGGGNFSAYKLWADAVLAKPVEIDDLTGKIRELLQSERATA